MPVVFGQFHQCGNKIVLSEGRRVASGSSPGTRWRGPLAKATAVAAAAGVTVAVAAGVAVVGGPVALAGAAVGTVIASSSLSIAFSNDPIPKGVQFSVKVLQESKDYVSPFIQTPCSLQCMPCLYSAHTRGVDQLAPRLVSFG